MKTDPNSRSSPVDEIRCDAYNDDPTRVRRVAARLPRGDRLADAGALLQALGHPARATILAAVEIEPLCVCELSVLLDMSAPALSHHLRILASAGVIEPRKEGKFAVYHPINSSASAALRAVLETQSALQGASR
ncbi:MAG: winged helix-turn-helix transcriptional regulator [Armatimonadetes bacterium]|nr:winged helix-turn-helix transcriptional regulator [Armatimonadota bacterium]